MEWLKKFMLGRYGLDQLGLGLFILTFIVAVLSGLTHSIIFTVCTLILISYFYYRFLSKNHYTRQQENFKFLRICSPIQKRLKRYEKQFKERKQYKYFTCPQCRQALRVPRGKGKVCITCPKCKHELHKRT